MIDFFIAGVLGQLSASAIAIQCTVGQVNLYSGRHADKGASGQ